MKGTCKMRTKAYNTIMTAMLLMAELAVASCEKVEELPPTSDTNYTNRYYRVGNPTLLNDEQQAQYNEIKAEYEAATK